MTNNEQPDSYDSPDNNAWTRANYGLPPEPGDGQPKIWVEIVGARHDLVETLRACARDGIVDLGNPRVIEAVGKVEMVEREIESKQSDAAAQVGKQVRLGDLEPGTLFLLEGGGYGIVSEYAYSNAATAQRMVIIESGEYGHFEEGNARLVEPVKLKALLAMQAAAEALFISINYQISRNNQGMYPLFEKHQALGKALRRADRGGPVVLGLEDSLDA